MHQLESPRPAMILAHVLAVVALATIGYWGLGSPKLYEATLGHFNLTYSVDSLGDVRMGSTAFARYTDRSALHSDADIYYEISRYQYYPHPEVIYGSARAAFFPGYPLLWRWSGLSPSHVVWLNLGMAALGFCLLMLALLPAELARSGYGWLVLLFPSWAVFGIAYAEALWFLMGALAIWGAVRHQYVWLAVGLFGLGFVRPAVMLLVPAKFLLEAFQAVALHRNGRLLTLRLLATLGPLLLGFGATMALQWYLTGIPLAYFESHMLWVSPTPGLLRPWRDWSVEGYWVSVVLIGGPLCLGLCWGAGQLWRLARSGSARHLYGPMLPLADYLLGLMLLYGMAVLMSRLYSQAGSLVGYQRYTLASPMGVVAMLLLAQRVQRFSSLARLAYTAGMMAGIWLIWHLSLYGKEGNWANFLPGILTGLLLLAGLWWPTLNARIRWLCLTGLTAVALLVWWNLIHQFLVNAWLFF